MDNIRHYLRSTACKAVSLLLGYTANWPGYGLAGREPPKKKKNLIIPVYLLSSVYLRILLREQGNI